jgi:hypothetical protein
MRDFQQSEFMEWKTHSVNETFEYITMSHHQNTGQNNMEEMLVKLLSASKQESQYNC